MRIDCHLHTRTESKYFTANGFDQNAFLADLKTAGMDGACIYSLSPLKYPDMPYEQRMQYALDACEGCDTLFPFFWINPTEPNALEQVDVACEKGFAAFKMIPNHYRVDCEESLAVLRKIAEKGKAVMFHSGICWDGMKSSENLKPMVYEALLEIPNLRFCLAHVSWPWYDECIALYGKVRDAKYWHSSCEMFIDISPGTPEPYREDVFKKLLTCYDMRYNLMFGTDSNTGGYHIDKSLKLQTIDNELYEKYIQEDVEDYKDHVYGKNLLRFLGIEK